MIPRFNYSYSFQDIRNGLQSLISRRQPSPSPIENLFPAAVHYPIASARAGIYYALRAFGLKPGARIGVQPYTCSSVMSAITSAGYRPFFIDINPQLSLDVDDLHRKLPYLDALIVTHTFGIPAPIRQLKDVVGQLPVIEDCAHAFLSFYEGRPVGTFFDMAVFSFGDGKFPALGSGGLLLVNTQTYVPPVAALLSGLKQPGLVSELMFMGGRLVKSIIHSRAGSSLMQFLLSEQVVQNRSKSVSPYPNQERQPYRSVAYIGQEQFRQLTGLLRQQQQHVQYLANRQYNQYQLLAHPTGGNAFAFVLFSPHRNELFTFLRKNGIGAGKHFQHAKTWALQFGYEPGSCPNFEQLVDTILTTPCHYALTKNDLAKIDECLSSYARVNMVQV